jgi:hypothetical protein
VVKVVIGLLAGAVGALAVTAAAAKDRRLGDQHGRAELRAGSLVG